MFYRVKGSLQNSNTFGKAFDCPFINEYSPQVKCEVWWWHRTLTADWALHEGGWTTQLLLSNSRNIKRDKKKTNKYGQPCYWTICSHKIFKRFHDECFIHTWMNFSCVCHLNIALVYLFVTPFKFLHSSTFFKIEIDILWRQVPVTTMLALWIKNILPSLSPQIVWGLNLSWFSLPISTYRFVWRWKAITCFARAQCVSAFVCFVALCKIILLVDQEVSSCAIFCRWLFPLKLWFIFNRIACSSK